MEVVLVLVEEQHPETKKQKIVYNISDLTVEEGNEAQFVVAQKQEPTEVYLLLYKTLDKGSATAGEDYLAVDGILGFAPNEIEKVITVTTLYDTESEGDEDFCIQLRMNSLRRQLHRPFRYKYP